MGLAWAWTPFIHCVQADVCMAGAEGEEAGWAWRPLGEERQNPTLLKQGLRGVGGGLYGL